MTDATLRRRWLVGVGWGMTAVLAMAVGWWAAIEATRPPAIVATEQEPVTVEVIEGTVSVVQAYGVEASWPTSPAGANGLTGTLTSMNVQPSGSHVDAGAVLYTVDLAPVIAVAGTTPAFRDLGRGMSGPDVQQLQQFLIDAGYLGGDADGSFGARTAAAVNQWSASIGVPQTGTVPLGRVMFLPSLPADLAPAEDVRVGARVSASDDLLVTASASPQFSFRVLPEAVSRTTEGMRVVIEAGSTQWLAQVERLTTSADQEGTTIAILEPIDGADTICGADCAVAVPLGGQSVLPAQLIVVPESSGPQVPAAAVQTDSSGATYVTLGDGTREAVTVTASSNGRSIVQGIEVGDRVVVPAGSAGES